MKPLIPKKDLGPPGKEEIVTVAELEAVAPRKSRLLSNSPCFNKPLGHLISVPTYSLLFSLILFHRKE